MQFPVSSGMHHRTNENEWVPVEPTKPPKKDKDVSDASAIESTNISKHKATVTAPTEDVPLPTTGKLIVSTPPNSLHIKVGLLRLQIMDIKLVINHHL